MRIIIIKQTYKVTLRGIMQKPGYFRLCGSSDLLGSLVDECWLLLCQSNKVPRWGAFPDRTTAVLPTQWQENTSRSQFIHPELGKVMCL